MRWGKGCEDEGWRRRRRKGNSCLGNGLSRRWCDY